MTEVLDVTDRFDGAARWATLSEEDRAAIGAATLERIASEYMADRSHDDARADCGRVARAAGYRCDVLLGALFVEAIPREAVETRDGAPRIPSLLGMVCRGCGCSQDDGCPEDCGWAADSLCTSCADRALGGDGRTG